MPKNQVTVLGPEPTDIPFDGKIRFLSYNLFIRPPGIKSNGEDYKDERLRDFLKVVGDYDLLCLQELFEIGSPRRQDFLDKAALVGLRYSAYVPGQKFGSFPPRIIDGGVTILSRFPIADADYMLYSAATLSTADAWCAKGAVWAKVQLLQDKGHLHVFSTHMQAHDHPDGRYSKVRLVQAQELRKFMAQKASDGYPAILAGDFNVNGRRSREDGHNDSDEFKDVWSILAANDKGRPWQDLLRDFHNGEHVITGGDEFIVNRGTKPTNEEHCSKRLDYVLFDSGAGHIAIKPHSCKLNHFYTPEDLPYVRLSDHLGVDVVFTV